MGYFTVKKKSPNRKYYSNLDDDEFASTLEAPSGKNPNQNAWLTLTVRYQLNFVDSKNRVPGIIVRQGGRYYAKDADQKSYSIADWNDAEMKKFQKGLQLGEKFWNQKFVLLTPKTFNGLDFASHVGEGWFVRPNVLCLFRLKADAARPHRTINVVRLKPGAKFRKPFRSHEHLYESNDVHESTLGHELGHALSMGHILVLKGDTQCIAAARAGRFPRRCYGVTPQELANIMGMGTLVELINAKPWLNRIASHTDLRRHQWRATQVMTTPPRKIPMQGWLSGVETFN